MTITRLEFPSLMEMQQAFFIDRFGTERGKKLFRIMVECAQAYDYDGTSSLSLPYYLYAAATLNKVSDLPGVLPPRMQFVLAMPQTEIATNEAGSWLPRIIATSFWTRPDAKQIVTDYIDAAAAQAELTQRYLKENYRITTALAYRTNRRSADIFSVYADRDPRRMVFSASLDSKTAQKFAGIAGRVLQKKIPAEHIIDSYLTNVGFVHEEYEIRYLRLVTE